MHGLANLGNTCYLNFILQILFNTPDFLNQYIKYQTEALKSRDDCHRHPLWPILEGFNKLQLVYTRHLEPNDPILNKALSDFVKLFFNCHSEFGMGGQGDGHEYLTFLLRTFHDVLYVKTHMKVYGTPNTYGDHMERQSIEDHRIHGSSTTELMLRSDSKSKSDTCYNSIVFNMFSGQFRFQTQCRNSGCGYVSNRFETFRCCEIPIGNPDQSDVKLEDILTEFTGVTELDTDYECDKCKVRTKCYRRCSFWRMPTVLIISLKRGLHHYKNGRYIELKDTRPVQAPEILDLSAWSTVTRPQMTYELYATGNHVGVTHGGHYYAQIKKDGVWHLINDHKVNVIDSLQHPEHICLLFYHLK